jgi:hypothetical protein
VDLWRNGSASDSRSEGCVFDSRQVQSTTSFFPFFFFFFLKHILGLGYYSDELGLKAHFIMNVFCKLQSISLGM